MTEAEQFLDLARNVAGMDDRFIDHSSRELFQSTLKELRGEARALLNKLEDGRSSKAGNLIRSM